MTKWKMVPTEPTEEMIKAACLNQSLEKYDTYEDWWDDHSSGVSRMIRKMIVDDYIVMVEAAPVLYGELS